MGAVIKIAMRSMISWNGLVQIVRAMGVLGTIVLLSFVSGAGQIMIGEGWRQFITEDRLDGGPPCIVFPAARMMRGLVNSFCRYFRLEDWRHWLCLARQPAFHPSKLRSVEGGHLNHCSLDLAAVMQKLCAQ